MCMLMCMCVCELCMCVYVCMCMYDRLGITYSLIPMQVRFVHVPYPQLQCFLYGGKRRFIDARVNTLKEYSLNVRLAGVDAPEMGHFGYLFRLPLLPLY